MHRFELPSPQTVRPLAIDFTMADAHLEKNTTSLHEDLKSDNTHTVAEHGHAATDVYDSTASRLVELGLTSAATAMLSSHSIPRRKPG